MTPIIYNTVNEAIIGEMRSAGIYDTFMEQVGRQPPGPRQIFVFIAASPRRLTYYIYHRGFPLEAENGYSAITIQDPAACPQAVAIVENSLRETFTSAITTLWVDDPQRRN